MRKLIIDTRIRGFADDYKTKLQKQCPNVISDLKMLSKFVCSNNTFKDSTVVKDYINAIISDYPTLLTLEPKGWDLKKYDDILKRESGLLNKKVLYSIDSKGKKHMDELYKRIVFCMRYTDARRILGPIHQNMGLKSCVYCNAASTLTGLDGDVFYQMDHYLPKSEYPFLCTCFYNLQPSCGICNGHKLTQSSDFGLYVNAGQGKEVNPFLFVPQVVDVGGMGNQNCIDIDFTGKYKKPTAESKDHDRVFHIKSLYHGHRDKVKDLYDKNYKLNDSYIQATHDSYGINPTRQDVLAFMENFPTEEERIHDKPFTKLKQDTMKQLKEKGLI